MTANLQNKDAKNAKNADTFSHQALDGPLLT